MKKPRYHSRFGIGKMGRVFSSHQNAPIWDLPGSPVVKTLSFQYKGRGFNPWLGNKDPTCCIAKKKKKRKKKKCFHWHSSRHSCPGFFWRLEPPHWPEEPCYLVIQFLDTVLLINNQAVSNCAFQPQGSHLQLSSPRILLATHGHSNSPSTDGKT